MKVSGIYFIRNKVNSGVYIGSAVDLARRIRDHTKYLKSNSHHNRHLQNSWNTHGCNSFEFQILEYVLDKTSLIKREQYWIDTLKCFGCELYNTAPIAGSTLGVKYTDEGRRRISEKAKERFLDPNRLDAMRQRVYDWHHSDDGRAIHSAGQRRRFSTDESRRELSDRMKAKWQDPAFRAHMESIGKAGIQKYTSQEERDRLAAIGSNPHKEAQRKRFSTPEGRAEASRARRPRDTDGNPVKFNLKSPTGEIYLDIPVITDFCKELGVNVLGIGKLLRMEVDKYKGWTRYNPGDI